MDFQVNRRSRYLQIPGWASSLKLTSLRYQTGTASDQTIFTLMVLPPLMFPIMQSYGGNAPSPTFNPRRFVGSVIYELAVTGNCTPFTNFAIDSISGIAVASSQLDSRELVIPLSNLNMVLQALLLVQEPLLPVLIPVQLSPRRF